MRHKQLLCCLLCYKIPKSPKIFIIGQLEKFDEATFLEGFERAYWDDLVDHDDPKIAEQFWTKVFVGILDKHAIF